MTNDRDDSGEAWTQEELRAGRLLAFGRSESRRPVDPLLDRLEAGADLGELLAAGPGRPLVTAAALPGGPHGVIPLETLREVHADAKRAFATDVEGRLPGLAAYFTAIAVALGQHGALISRRPATKLRRVLLDLGAVTPEPWSELFVAALERLGTSEPGSSGGAA